MLSLADTSKYYQLLLSQGIGMGLGGGLVLVPAVSVQAHHWKKRRSLAMGITFTGTLHPMPIFISTQCLHLTTLCSGSSCGGIVFPIMLNQLLHSSAGFAGGTRATGFLVLGLLTIANCLMSTRLPSAKTRGSRPKLNLREKLTDAPYMIAIAG